MCVCLDVTTAENKYTNTEANIWTDSKTTRKRDFRDFLFLKYQECNRKSNRSKKLQRRLIPNLSTSHSKRRRAIFISQHCKIFQKEFPWCKKSVRSCYRIRTHWAGSGLLLCVFKHLPRGEFLQSLGTSCSPHSKGFHLQRGESAAQYETSTAYRGSSGRVLGGGHSQSVQKLIWKHLVVETRGKSYNYFLILFLSLASINDSSMNTNWKPLTSSKTKKKKKGYYC